MAMKRLLVGTDGSEPATLALEWAGSLAKQLDAELIVVYVFSLDSVQPACGFLVLPEGEVERAREQSQAALAGAWSAPLPSLGTRYRVLLETGDTPGALIDAARREKADMIIIGNRGLGGFREAIFGSVGHHLTHHSPVAIVVVPSHRS